MLTIAAFLNPTTGKEYTAGNITRLQDCVDSNPRFTSGQFATFRQWLSVGRVVNKGEKCLAKLIACGADTLAPVKGEPAGTVQAKRDFLKSFCVFALEQTSILEGGPVPLEPKEDKSADPAPEAQETAKEDKPGLNVIGESSDPNFGEKWLAERLGEIKTAKAEESCALHAPAFKLDQIRAKVERLRSAADACHADRLTNTAKRLGQAMGKRLEGDRLKRQANMLEAVCASADGFEPFAGTMSTQALIAAAGEAARYETKHTANGYHSYLIETDKPQHAQPIHNALRRLLDPGAVKAEAAKSVQIQAEAELRQCDFPGFFPTPAAVIAVMLEQVGDLTGLDVLEPSAGKGNLVQAAFNAGAKTVRVFEVVPKLLGYLERFVKVPPLPACMVSQNADFMDRMPPTQHAGVDVVLMNPPFEKDQAPKHVLHALSWLKPGGKLVAVMPANWSEKTSADHLLRTIDDNGFSFMEMDVEANAFAGAGAFRQTGVRVSLAIIVRGDK